MRRDGLLRLGWIALFLIVTGISSGCSPEVKGAQTSAPVAPAAAPEGRQVRVVTPRLLDAFEGFPTHLYVERDVAITGRNPGIIEQVLVDRGDRVKKGDPLAVVESDLLAGEVKMAEQELRLAEAEYERARMLRGQDIVSEQEALRREIERDVAQSALTLARAMLERCTIRAPFDGRVVERRAVVGQRLIEDDTTELFRMVANDALRARIHVPEDRLPALKVGGSATVESADGRQRWPSSIVFVGPVVDAASDTAPIIVELRSAKGLPPIGSSVRVRLPDATGPASALLAIPREAVKDGRLLQGGEISVLVAVEGRAELRKLDLVDVAGFDLTVRGGLTPADQVIVGGLAGLAPGDPVRVETEIP